MDILVTTKRIASMLFDIEKRINFYIMVGYRM